MEEKSILSHVLRRLDFESKDRMIKPVIEIITRPVIFIFISSFKKQYFKRIFFFSLEVSIPKLQQGNPCNSEIQKFIKRKVFFRLTQPFQQLEVQIATFDVV